MGKLYKVLHNVEMARQNAVRNAKAANLPASDDMSLLALSDLYRYQNNTEDVEIDSENSQEQYYETWEEPEGWPDLKTILSEAEDIVQNNANYKPYIAITLDGRIDITQPLMTNYQSNFLFKTSDNQLLTGDVSSISWDTTKDIHCSDGSVVRYVIVYIRETHIPNATMYYCKFYQWPVLHVVYGAHTFNDTGPYATTSANTIKESCKTIKVIDCLPGCIMLDVGSIHSCSSLRKLCLRFKENYNMGAPSSTGVMYQDLTGLSNLQELTFHNLTKAGVVGETNPANNSPINIASYCLKRVDFPDYEEGYINITCALIGGLTPSNELVVNTPKLKKVMGFPIVFNNNKKEIIDDTIETSLTRFISTGTNTSYLNGLETIKMMRLKELTLTGGNALVYEWPDLTSVYLPVLETLTISSHTSNSLIRGERKNGIYISMASLTDFVCPTPLTSASKATLDLPAVTNIDIYSLTYSSTNYPYLTILAPNLETIKLDNWSGSGSQLYGTLVLKHNNPIDFTLSKLTTSINVSSAYGYLIDDNINTITIEGTSNIYNICRLLIKSKFKKLVCSFTDYSASTTIPSEYNTTEFNLKYTEPLLRDNVVLDFATGSTLDKSMGKWMNDEEFAKLFTNLITLPEGETRTLTLGTNLTKLSEETKAIATNKGWVIE